VWFVSKQVLIESGGGARGIVLWAAAENMVGATTKHTPLETRREMVHLDLPYQSHVSGTFWAETIFD
jgi:hypothetical protein